MSKKIGNNGNLALQPSYEPEEEDDLPTNRLYSGRLTILPRLRPSDLEQDESQQNTTDRLETEMLPDDLPQATPHNMGMGQNTGAPRIVPTRVSRLRTGLRRSTLIFLLAAAVGASLAGGGYLLATTPWLSTVTTPPTAPASPQAPISASVPQSPPQAPVAAVQPQPQVPVTGQSQPKDDQQQASSLPSGPAPAADAYKKQRDWGIEQYKQGNYSKAIDLLEGYVLVNGDDPAAYYQLGLAYMAVNGRDRSLDDAEMAFRTATALQPTWAAPQQGLAESMIRRGFYSQAIAPAEKATQLQPAMTEAWITLGRAYQGAGRDADATKAFAQAIRLAPTP